MKKLIAFLFMIPAILAVSVSCHKEASDFEVSDLVGTWEFTSRFFIAKEDGVVVRKGISEITSLYHQVIQFTADGKAYSEITVLSTSETTYHSGAWKLSGNYLISDGEGEKEIVRIIALTDSKLKISQNNSYETNGILYDSYKEDTFTLLKKD